MSQVLTEGASYGGASHNACLMRESSSNVQEEGTIHGQRD